VYYTQAIKEVADGTWTNTPVWWGMKEGLMSLAPIADFVPQAIKDQVAAEQERIINGEFDVFEGPIYDNAGTLQVAEGEVMSDEAKLSFDWLVDGVIGEIPK
jgi:basic membrane protein A